LQAQFRLLAIAAAGAWVSNLNDGFKYVLGSKYLPTGFEVGFNHYAGTWQLLLAAERIGTLKLDCLSILFPYETLR
jgi:hypothetical protein